jgi:3-oxoadipate enol-lactonase
MNRGAGAEVWTRDADGNFDQILMPETDPREVSRWLTPVLCVAGSEDIVVPPRAAELVADALGGAACHLVDATGHSVFFERAAAFNAITLPFLRQQLAGA